MMRRFLAWLNTLPALPSTATWSGLHPLPPAFDCSTETFQVLLMLPFGCFQGLERADGDARVWLYRPAFDFVQRVLAGAEPLDARLGPCGDTAVDLVLSRAFISGNGGDVGVTRQALIQAAWTLQQMGAVPSARAGVQGLELWQKLLKEHTP